MPRRDLMRRIEDYNNRLYGNRGLVPANTVPSFEELFDNYNDDLTYVGDFEKGGAGYRYIESQYNKDPKKYIEDAEKAMGTDSNTNYVSKINIRAGKIQDKYDAASNGDKSASKWVKDYERRQQRVANGLSVG